MHKISVIIPVYKVEKYLAKCLDSVIAQSYPHLEIILVDDGSPDNCGAICDEYAGKDDRIVVIHQENRGLSGARNSGLERATGDFISFVDSDDYVAKDYIEKLYYALGACQADIAICNVKLLKAGSSYQAKAKKFTVECYDSQGIIDAMYAPNKRGLITLQTAWAMLVPRHFYDDVRFPMGKINEDAFTNYKLYMKARTISYYSEPLYFYVQTQGSIMRTPYSLKRLDVIEALEGRLSDLQKHGYDIRRTIIRLYAEILWAKSNIIRNHLPYDTKLLDKKIAWLDKLAQEQDFTFRQKLKKFVERDLARIVFFLYSIF